MSELAIAAFAAAEDRHCVDEPTDARYRRFARTFDERAYRGELAARGLRFVGKSDAAYPRALLSIFDPPQGLFVRGGGSLDLLERPLVAIVGARSCSGYGRHVARTFARDLAAAGLVVVSGMARGIDSEAHRGALEARGLTVAVLGCGVDRDYPASNAQLARAIAKDGLIVSEYAPGVEPAPWRFPARNRIVAGLVSVAVVVEARERSGALITADLAMEEGRDVFAVPGEITSALSAGTNHLLQHGAAVATSSGDVLAAFGLEPAPPPLPELGGTAAAVLRRLREQPAGADVLARGLGLDAGAVAAALVELELAGAVSESAGVYRA